MTNPAMSRAMRERWADPDWRERQCAAIQDGHAKSNTRPGRRLQNGYRDARGCVKANCWIDEETFLELKARAVRTKQSLSEIIRTYIQWGLDAEGEK